MMKVKRGAALFGIAFLLFALLSAALPLDISGSQSGVSAKGPETWRVDDDLKDCPDAKFTGIWSSNTFYGINNFINTTQGTSKGGSDNSWNSPEEITCACNGNTYTDYLGNGVITGNTIEGEMLPGSFTYEYWCPAREIWLTETQSWPETSFEGIISQPSVERWCGTFEARGEVYCGPCLDLPEYRAPYSAQGYWIGEVRNGRIEGKITGPTAGDWRGTLEGSWSMKVGGTMEGSFSYPPPPYESGTWRGTRTSEITAEGTIIIGGHDIGPCPENPCKWHLEGYWQGKRVECEYPPLASFTYSPENPLVDEEITFDASSSYDTDGTIVKYEWDFGDGNRAEGEVVTHAYGEAGEYTVTLRVMDNDGLQNSISKVIEVGGQIYIKNVKMSINGTPLDITDPVFLNGVDLNVKFEPEIDWGDETPGTIKYITPNGTYEETGPKTFNVGTEFGVGGKLKIVAVSSGGIESEPYEVSFEVASVPVGESSWFSFDKGSLDTGSPKYSNFVSVVLNLIKEDIDGASIPANLPIFGGKSVNVEMFPSVNLEVGLNGKGKFLNLSIGKGKDSSVSYAGKRVPVVEKKGGRRVELAKKCQLGAAFDIGAAFSYDKAEKKWNYGGSLGLGLEGYCQTPPYYIVVYAGPVPIPLYGRLGLGVDVYNSLNLLALTSDSSGGPSFIDPAWDGMFTIYPYGKLMFGAGAADVAAVEGYGKGGLDASFHYPAEPHLKDVCIKLNAGVTVVILIFHHDFDLWHHDWCLYKAKTGFQAIELGVSGTGLTPLSRDYLKKRPYARFYKQGPVGGFKGMVVGAEKNIVQENIYPYSQPVIVSKNGNTYIFWLYDDPERGSLNRTELVFSKWAEDGWSTPKAVSDDGTADFHPQAGILPDGRVLVVWENIKQELPDDAILDDMAAKMEISYAVYNPTSDSWQTGTLTNNAFLDRSPKLAIGEDGTALLVWIENKGNDLFGSMDKTNDLMYAFWDGNNWASNQVIATDLGPVIKTSLAYKGTEGLLIWESDEDDDLSTLNDRELREAQFNKRTAWKDEGLFTRDNIPDLNPQVLYRNGEPYLIWLKDNDLVMVKDLDPSSEAVAVEDMKSPGGMSFKAIDRPEGLNLFWSDSSEKGADIYVAYWDDNHNKWGKPKQLTDDDSLERSIDGCYIDADTVKLIYDKVKVTYTTEGIPQPERTDLYTLSYKEGTDIALNYISSSKSSPAPGEDVVITAEVANIGESVEEDIPVSFYKGKPQAGGELIGTASVDGLLAPEESKEVSITWRVNGTPTVIYAVADPNQEIINDRDWANNTINIAVGTLPGDANGDGKTTIDEVQKAINQFLEIVDVRPCNDLDGDGNVTIDEVQKVINAFLGIV